MGLGAAEITKRAAYVSGWADYLRFLGAYPDLFPAANAALDPASLATSSLPAVVALQGAWIDLATSGAPLPCCSAPLGLASPRAAPRDFIVRWQRSATPIVTF